MLGRDAPNAMQKPTASIVNNSGLNMADNLPAHRFAAARDPRDDKQSESRPAAQCPRCFSWGKCHEGCAYHTAEVARLTPSLYRVVSGSSPHVGSICEYVRTTAEGRIVLMVGQPWKKFRYAFDAAEVEAIPPRASPQAIPTTNRTADPRINPQPGRVLRKRGSTRTVTNRDGDYIRYQFSSGRTNYVPLIEWIEWAKDAEVIE